MPSKNNKPLTPAEIVRGLPQTLPGLSPELRKKNLERARAQITWMRKGVIPEEEEQALRMMETTYGLR